MISVIVPVYQTKAYLKQCIESLLQQTYRDIEIILINDGATDGSAEILDQYQAQNPSCIRVIHQENHGIGATRNLGIKEATGDYICFLDSDDYVAPTYLEDLFDAVSSGNAEIAVCDYYNYYEDQQKTALYQVTDFPNTSLKNCPRLLFDINPSPWNKLYKRSFLIQHELLFSEQLKYEDVAFVLPALLKATCLTKVNKPLLYYRIRSASETTSMNARVYDMFQVLDLINSAFQHDPDYAVYQPYLEFFNIYRMTVYNLQQVYQTDVSVINRFTEDSFCYLDQHFPNWKTNPYFRQDNSFAELLIKKSKQLTRLYVKLMRMLRR